MNLSKRSLFSMSLVAILLMFVFVTNIVAAPQGGEVTVGEAEIIQQDNITDINQSTDKAAINWQNFGIDVDEVVNFNQPGIDSIILNRVLGNEKSIIDGALNADGQVWLLNSNGVLFGKNAAVNTSGLLATTKELLDEDFTAGNYEFTGESGEAIINRGTIDIGNSAYLALLSKEVVNEGLIKAELGQVHLRGAKGFSLDINNSLINLTVTKGELDALVENKQAIIADGGEVYLSTNAVDELLSGVVNNKGLVEAKTVDDVMGDSGYTTKEGYIEIFAHGGTAEVGGKLNTGRGEGFIETSGKEFAIQEGTEIISGNWLLDPVNVTIDSTLAGVIESSLSSGDVTINTAGDANNIPDTTSYESGTVGDIIVGSAISWSEATKLTLDADNNVNVNAVIENTNNNNGGVYFDAAGDVIFDTEGKVIVNNVHQLQWINTALNRTDGEIIGTYELGSDIDASVTSGWNGGGFVPIGDVTNTFSGILAGGGYTVDGLYINRPLDDYVGLFGGVYYGNKVDSQINNLRLTNVDIRGNNFVGGLAGNILVAKVENISLSGNITGSNNIGGIVGFADYNGVIDNSNSSVQVEGSRYIGGLAGRMRGATITNSYSHGSVLGSGSNSQYVGGLAGSTEKGYIGNNYATADVSAYQYVGGLVGNSNNGSSGPGTYFENDYATGQVTGDSYVGGLVGWSNYGLIKNSYATGQVSGNSYLGGLLGMNKYNSNFLNNNFWNIETSGQLSSAGEGVGAVEGLTTAEMQDASNFSVWDTEVWSYGLAEKAEGYGFSRPFLVNITTEGDIPEQSQLFAGGWGGLTEAEDGIIGADGSAYEITDWYQLDNIRLVLDESGVAFALNNSLDEGTSGYNELVSTETGFEPIGDEVNPFSASFDGQNFTINKLYIDNSDEYTGLFAYVSDGLIKNVGLTEVDINSGSNKVGSIAGFIENSRIEKSYSTGNVSINVDNRSDAGGLVGYTQGSVIEESYSTVDVSGKDTVGGLVGRNDSSSSIKNSYATGNVSGVDYVGGLVGNNYISQITNSYATGEVSGTDYIGGLLGTHTNSNLNNNFWNIETSGIEVAVGNANLVGVKGLTTAEMQNPLVYRDIDNGGTIWKTKFNPEIEGLAVSFPYLANNEPEVIPGEDTLFADGFGTIENPYGITDWQELSNVNAVMGYFFQGINLVLENDLNENTTAYNKYVNTESGWNPLGSSIGLEFVGSFDGQNYTIDNLKINRPYTHRVGLFGVVDNADIRNLNIENAEIRGYSSIGALAGIARDNTHIENVHTDALLEGNYDIGGLVGRLQNSVGTIKNSSSTGTVKARNNGGGLAGTINDGTIENSFSEAEVIYNDALVPNSLNYVGGISVQGRPLISTNFGGLVGAAYNSTIKNSYALGNVEATEANRVGGLVGSSTVSTIESSYAVNTVTGNEQVGGLIGLMRGSVRRTLKNSYSSGSVSGNNRVGGLVGTLEEETIINSYSSNEVNSEGAFTGGLVGEELGDNTITASFFDKDTAPGMNDEQDYGKTTGELKDIATFAENGWDIVEDDSLEEGYPIFGNENTIWVIAPKAVDIVNASDYIRDIYVVIPVTPQSDFSSDDIIANITSLPGVISVDDETGGSTAGNIIYLSDLLSGQGSTDGADDVVVRVIRVRIAKNSLIALVNGGVNLPNGVDQIFFIADEV